MKVFTKWPALVPAIRRAGHEPVLLDSEVEPEPDSRTHVITCDMGVDCTCPPGDDEEDE